ncbi:hypothetical protein ACF0H5_018595 [Mactra antiquata]
MEVTSPGPPAIPPRRTSHDLPAPPVPSRWDLCSRHTGSKFTAICTTCVRFLCRDCLLSEIYYHQKCSITYLDDNSMEACHKLHSALNTKLDCVCSNLTDFHRSLSQKKERMLKKRNETMSEIQGYFNRLKDRLLIKLQRHEDSLMAVLNDKVNDQEIMISEKIRLCDKTLNSLEEKRAILYNQARNSKRDGNTISLLKKLANTVEDVQNTERIKKEIAAVRDAFLVIRFFVNSENEEAILNSDIACVEVLNSRLNSSNTSSLESERINEVFQSEDQNEVRENTVPITERLDNDNLHNATHNILENREAYTNSDLRVELPARDDNIVQQESETVSLSDFHNVRDAPADVVNDVNDENEQEREQFDTHDSFGQLPPEREEGDIESNDSRLQTTQPHDDDNLQDDLVDLTEDTESASESENESENSNENTEQESTNPGIIMTVTPCEAASTDERSASRTSERSQTNCSDRSMSASPFSVRDDDPPPPYPGLPVSPVQPRPNELPPPYPSGPPPPYSQSPETQVPTQSMQQRQRLNGESGRPLSSGSGGLQISRPVSDSDLLSRLREMPIGPPTQTHTPRLSRPKVGKTFSVNEANDRRTSGIFALATVKDNDFLIVDRWNKKLKYFSNAGVSFGGLIFREEPWDITGITNDLVAVTVPKLSTLYKIKVTDNSVITTSTVPTQRMYACVSYSRNTEIFVCGQVPQFGEPIIDVIGVNGGEILQSFRSQLNMDQIRLSYPRYVKVDDEGTVIVCDWNLKCLTVFKLDGTMVGMYRGTVEFPLNEPSGIAYNNATKEIFVIDAKHNSTQGAIHKLSSDCTCKEIIRFDNEFRIARAIVPYGANYALGNKSGIVSIFSRRHR